MFFQPTFAHLDLLYLLWLVFPHMYNQNNFFGSNLWHTFIKTCNFKSRTSLWSSQSCNLKSIITACSMSLNVNLHSVITVQYQRWRISISIEFVYFMLWLNIPFEWVLHTWKNSLHTINHYIIFTVYTCDGCTIYLDQKNSMLQSIMES